MKNMAPISRPTAASRFLEEIQVDYPIAESTRKKISEYRLLLSISLSVSVESKL